MNLETAQRVVAEHREAEQKRDAETKRKYIGRYFKYHNSYGGDHARWWLYGAATEVTDYGQIQGLTFQHTSMDRIEIEPKGSISMGSGGWQEISAEEFWTAATGLLGTIAPLLRRTKIRPVRTRKTR